ncbi:uncharacterized protein EI90DRAFT_3019968 [Cantharellus anzutake]|uniref:uncharacterized protein n=1 Tax=Cantharellus anzutake TaxID=1750568 RepID=UPI0019041816|nr:uncharacterized protein EI90DRAFT_3019968 [Cantharellus anzutake]KAF8322907.1 hypothetical protein EI90DRAFT_3019968 [Cantharellus anzutake]
MYRRSPRLWCCGTAALPHINATTFSVRSYAWCYTWSDLGPNNLHRNWLKWAYGVMAVHTEFAIQRTGVRFPESNRQKWSKITYSTDPKGNGANAEKRPSLGSRGIMGNGIE